VAKSVSPARKAESQLAREQMLSRAGEYPNVGAAFARAAKPEWQDGKICQSCTRSRKPACQRANALPCCSALGKNRKNWTAKGLYPN